METREVTTQEDAERWGMLGSPTVKVDGVDLEGEGAAPPLPSLACRLYDGSGIPAAWLIEAALLRSLRPGHVLFLCVANSARSQLAEGLARSLAPSGYRVSSAGSQPSRIRPEAVEVLAEVGIDAAEQRSKSVDEVEGPVDVVVTLCAEEVCPVWLGDALRIHWALPDPAAVAGDARVSAFRQVRDELTKRLEAWLRPAGSG